VSVTPSEILAGTPRPAGINGATVPGDPPGRPALVEVNQATAVLGGRTIWSHIDATVAAGEFVAVLGPNGVGKSTLLKAILGLTPLAAGRIRLLGRSPGQANHQVGYLPQRRTFDTSLWTCPTRPPSRP
jgi:zinc/manganese transport system ATP-binding protein